MIISYIDVIINRRAVASINLLTFYWCDIDRSIFVHWNRNLHMYCIDPRKYAPAECQWMVSNRSSSNGLNEGLSLMQRCANSETDDDNYRSSLLKTAIRIHHYKFYSDAFADIFSIIKQKLTELLLNY